MFRKAAFAAIVYSLNCKSNTRRFVENRVAMTSFALNAIKLQECRQQLSLANLDAFIVGSGDAHQSEYVSDNDMRRQFISGFTGSAGTALVMPSKALLWTDGRYFLQASKELSEEWMLMKSGEPDVLELPDWLIKNMQKGQSVGIDSRLISAAGAEGLQKTLAEKGIQLVAVDRNPVDIVWAKYNRPPAPCSPVIIHDVSRAGVLYSEKIDQVRKFIRDSNATALVVSMLDEVAWLFNIRGSDVQYNPVVIAYAVVTLDNTFLFVDSAKLSENVREHLSSGVEVRPYEMVESFLTSLAESSDDIKVLVDTSQLNWKLSRALGKAAINVTSPISLSKSTKNENELNGIRQAHIRDGAALTAFLHWLEVNVKAAPGAISETDAMAKLEEFRRKCKHHVGPSFATIAGYAANGAIIHYHAEPATAGRIGVDSLFLLDSGAQYLDGTTDVTR